MKQCPGCSRFAKVSERIEKDNITRKHWLITFCAHCGHNYDLEEYLGKVLSPEQEMNKYPWPENKKYWPGL